MLQKVVYLYKYMNDWGIFNEYYPKDFCNNLNMEDITDADCRHRQ